MDREMVTPVKVRLKTDLTHYHQNLTSGREGYAIGVYGQCSRLSARYTGVWFPGIHLLDVNWASLEIIDEQPLARQAGVCPAKEDREQREPLKLARNMMKRMGF